MDFSRALREIKAGGRVARTGWNGAGMYIELQVPDEGSKMGRPYIFMSPIDGALVPWVASQTDLLAADWVVIKSGTSYTFSRDDEEEPGGRP